MAHTSTIKMSKKVKETFEDKSQYFTTFVSVSTDPEWGTGA